MSWMYSFLSALGSALLLAPLVIRLYKRKGWVDDPKKYFHPKVVHTTPTPRGGGIVVGLAVLGAVVLTIPISVKLLALSFGLVVLILVGFWDDIASPHPIIRLSALFFVATTVVLAGIRMTFITNPFGGIFDFSSLPLLSFGLSVVWIVWCMNIVNFSTGLDGQMPGFVIVAAGTIALLSLRFFPDPSQHEVFAIAVSTMGAFAGFLVWNIYPQKLMSGFGASTIAGFLLAVLSIYAQSKLATAIIVLAIPMSDALYVIVKRLLKKKSPFWGDRSHLHHALLDYGFSKSTVAYIYWGSAILLGGCALLLSSGQKVFAILLIVTIICIIGSWIRISSTSFVKSDPDNG